MCGTVNHEKVAKKIGQIIIATRTDGNLNTSGIWSGFIRQESMQWWADKASLTNVAVKADSFTEQQYEFKLPNDNYCIAGVQLSNNVVMNGKLIGKAGSIKILTRPAHNEFESTIHGRWPVIIHNGPVGHWNVLDRFSFTKDYLVKGQTNLF